MSGETRQPDQAALGDADLAALAGAIAEPARAAILLVLTDGRALPASVLAAEAGVAPSTASALRPVCSTLDWFGAVHRGGTATTKCLARG